MAKVTAPLFSFGARGQIAKALVYFPWKGINAVRRHVIPANPKTTLQQAQRDTMEAAVDEWHLAKYLVGDRTAWNRYAAILATAMSGFNAFVRSWINIVVAGYAPNPPWEASITFGGAGVFDAYMKCDGAAADAHLDWGYSKTNMNTRANLVEAPAGTWRLAAIAATVGQTVYGRYVVHDGAANVLGESGIFQLLIV